MKNLIFDLDGTLVQLTPALVLVADVEELRSLKERYTFALVSGSPREEILYALKETGLAPLFSEALIVAKEDASGDKASGLPFLEMRKRISGAMIMIGDSAGDEQGSAKADIPFVRVPVEDSLEKQKAALAAAIARAVALLS